MKLVSHFLELKPFVPTNQMLWLNPKWFITWFLILLCAMAYFVLHILHFKSVSLSMLPFRLHKIPAVDYQI